MKPAIFTETVAILHKAHLRTPPPMNPCTFPEVNTTFAKDQPQYSPLPAYRYNDTEGTLAICWELSIRERLKLLFTGRLWHYVLTFNDRLQPQALTTQAPNFPKAPAAHEKRD